VQLLVSEIHGLVLGEWLDALFAPAALQLLEELPEAIGAPGARFA